MNHAQNMASYFIRGLNIITRRSWASSPHLQTINTYFLTMWVEEKEWK
jgi:hypothetical protein